MLKKIITFVCIFALTTGVFSVNPNNADAAKKIKLNKKKVTIFKGDTCKLKIKNGTKRIKVTWKSSKKKIAKITKKSTKGKKAYAVIKGIKTGKTIVTASFKKSGKKTVLKCKVTVKKAYKTSEKPDIQINTTNPPVVTQPTITDNPVKSDPIELYNNSMIAPIIMDESYKAANDNDLYYERSYNQVARAVTDLRQDMSMVTGAIDYYEIQSLFEDNQDMCLDRLDEASRIDSNKVPELITDLSGKNIKNAIIVGTIGNSDIIDDLINSGKLEEAKEIKGVWEGYIVKKVSNPISGVENALVVAGSDARGTIYGIYTVSEAIGVSPYYWYSDVPVDVKDNITYEAGTTIINKGPDVKYRGIFINDEEQSHNWAKEKFSADGKTPGVNYYRRVFELMLRLKSNTLWPAMHWATTAFNKETDSEGIPVNAKEAAEYGIIMGTSHCEILLRNNVGEWTDWFNSNKGKYDVVYPNNSTKAYDFTLNRELLLGYWRERLEANEVFESIFTLGIRGVHDEELNSENIDMYPGSTKDEKKVALLKDIISCQRDLIAEIYGEENVRNVPQVFIPYKEMNDVYNAGLNEFLLWDGSSDFNEDGVINYNDNLTDVMLMWAEDNENYLRQDLTEEEAAREGGAGIYYHVSYWGPPASYLWLNSTSLYTMSEQMHRGYSIGADDYWILNVGDIKPSEPSMEFFLKMAWDESYWNDTTVKEFLTNQAMRDYGLNKEDAKALSDAESVYYEMNGTRKAEFYAKPDYGNRPTPFNTSSNGDEALLWVEKSHENLEKVEVLYNKMTPEHQIAFYEHYYYNMLSLNDMIENWVYYYKNQLAGNQGRLGSAVVYKELSEAAGERVKTRINDFNNIHDNKWTKFMNYKQDGRGYVIVGDGDEKYIEVTESYETVNAACENNTKAGSGTIKFNSLIKDEKHYFDIFSMSANKCSWIAETSENWIVLSTEKGSTNTEERVIVTVDYDKISGDSTGTISVYNSDSNGNKIGNAVSVFDVIAVKSDVEFGDNKGYIEANGYVCIEAENYSESVEGSDGSYFGVILSEGMMSDAVKALPDTAECISSDWDNSAKLIYKVYFNEAGTYPLVLKRRPVLNEGSEYGIPRTMGIAVGSNNYIPTVMNGHRFADYASWNNTINMCENLKCNVTVEEGWNDIIVYRADASFVWDKMYIETVKNSVPELVLGPDESPNNIAEPNVQMIAELPKELKDYQPSNEIIIGSLKNSILDIGTSKSFDVQCYATNGKKVTLEAESSDSSIATVSVNDNSVVMTAKNKTGTVIITVKCKAENCTEIVKEFKLTVRDSSEQGIYTPVNNEFVINAADATMESAFAWTNVQESDVWTVTSDGNGLALFPDTGRKWEDTSSLSDNAPSINYTFDVTESGKYYVFLNMSNPDNNADSYHVLIDDQYAYTHNTGDMSGNLLWKSAQRELTLSAEKHTISIVPREDGLVVNQILITTDKNIKLTDGELK